MGGIPIISELIDIFRAFISSAPAIVKFMFFFFIITTLGSTMVNYFYGTNHICIDDELRTCSRFGSNSCYFLHKERDLMNNPDEWQELGFRYSDIEQRYLNQSAEDWGSTTYRIARAWSNFRGWLSGVTGWTWIAGSGDINATAVFDVQNMTSSQMDTLKVNVQDYIYEHSFPLDEYREEKGEVQPIQGTCVGDIPKLTFFHVDIFNPRMWILLTILIFLIPFAFKWNRQFTR